MKNWSIFDSINWPRSFISPYTILRDILILNYSVFRVCPQCSNSTAVDEIFSVIMYVKLYFYNQGYKAYIIIYTIITYVVKT